MPEKRAGSILGNPVQRVEDPKMLTSGGTYVADIKDPLLNNAAHVFYVRSSMAHARITSLDVSQALTAPGVVAIITGADIAADPSLTVFPPDFPAFPKTLARPWLASEVVRFVGEPVAIVVTEEVAQGPDAAERIVVEYEPLPVVVDPEIATASSTLVHRDHGSNTSMGIPVGVLVDPGTCEVVVRQRIVNPKIAPSPLEARSAASAWDVNGRLHHWSTNQGPHPFRDFMANALGIDKANIRVITPDVGGGFGAKATPYPEDVLLPWIARHVGRPVRWFSNRSDDMVNLGHGRAQIQYAELGGRRDGTIESYRLSVLQDSGAYPRYGAYLPNLTKLMMPGVYTFTDVDFASTSVLTNTTPVVPYRGAGRPEATAVLERIVDVFAAEIGMDPAEVRRKNLLQPSAFPYATPTGAKYDCGNYEATLDAVLAATDYDSLRAEQIRRRARGDRMLLGIGLSAYVEITGAGGSSEFGSVEVLPDGKVLARTGSLPYGTGHDTSWSMLISERLGIEMADITVIHGDTDAVPRGGLTGGSRSLQIAGSAIWGASAVVVDAARDLAAELLEASVDDVVLDATQARFHVAGTPTISSSWIEVAALAHSKGQKVYGELDFSQKGATFPSGVHLAVVEVDSETGHVKLMRFVACDDAGRILNPLIAAGQVHGGIAQGAAQALLEEMVYDADGNPQTGNFSDYGFISSAELPSFERIAFETPTPLNELGAKGIGESGTVGSTPAVHNAVCDALLHLGVRHVDMPTTSERVWNAINTATGAKQTGSSPEPAWVTALRTPTPLSVEESAGDAGSAADEISI
jgi:aerobic carbon-monoxide dehydrogenase large subunit